MRKTLFKASRLLFVLGAIVTANSTFVGCTDDLANNQFTGDGVICFQVGESQSWDTRSQAKYSGALVTDKVIVLRGENPSDSLFLHTVISDNTEMRHFDSPKTRGEQVEEENFYDAFGVFGYVYKGEWDGASCLPDYMYNTSVTKASGWSTSYMMPGLGQNIRFCAYAPYSCEGLGLPDKSQAGFPEFSYTVPADVTKQKDLLVAKTDGIGGNVSTPVTLNFSHALTAVRFVTGAAMQAGTISKISIKGVYSSATLNMENSTWGDYGTTTDFSYEFTKDVDGATGTDITSGETTFMMIPQILPEDAKIEIEFTDKLTSTKHVLSAKIGGKEWAIGKSVTYKISTNSINWEYVLNVSDIILDHTGTDKEYQVESYRINGNGVKEDVHWVAQLFSEDGQEWSDQKPEWLTNFTDNGGLGSGKGIAGAIIQTDIETDINDIGTLRAVRPVGDKANPYNLANSTGAANIENTANCYVVKGPGYYSLPLVYGNAIKNGADNKSAYTFQGGEVGDMTLETFIDYMGREITTPYITDNNTIKEASLVWQDAMNLVSDIEYNSSNNTVSFEVKKEFIMPGNAVIAVKDNDGRCIWSWHIWVTPADLSNTIATPTKDKYTPLTYNFMTAAIGGCEPGYIQYKERQCFVKFVQETFNPKLTGAEKVVQIKQLSGRLDFVAYNAPYYQWGRKDPFYPAMGKTLNKMIYLPDGSITTADPETMSSSGNAAISNGIAYPDKFNKTQYTDRTYSNLWDNGQVGFSQLNDINRAVTVKTIYDPSPVGFCMPTGRAFTGFTSNGEYASAASGRILGTVDVDNNWTFYNGLFVQAIGWRSWRDNAGMVNFSQHGYYWTGSSSNNDSGVALWCNTAEINPAVTFFKATAFTVRPVKEE